MISLPIPTDDGGEVNVDISAPSPAEAFNEFHEKHHSDLLMLVNKNILFSLSDYFFDEIKDNPKSNFSELLSFVKDLPKSKIDQPNDKLDVSSMADKYGITIHDFEPTVFELLLDLLLSIPAILPLINGLTDRGVDYDNFLEQLDELIGEKEDAVILGTYFVFMAATQTFRDAIPVSTNQKLITAFQAFSEEFSNVESPLNVGASFVEYTLPSTEHIPFYEIVRMRDDFESEFEMFWAAIQKIQFEIDQSASFDEQQKQVDEIYIKEVRPAVAELNNVIKNRKLSLKEFVASNLVPSFMQGFVAFSFMKYKEMDFASSAGLGAAMTIAYPFLQLLKQSTGKDISKSIEQNRFAILARMKQLKN